MTLPPNPANWPIYFRELYEERAGMMEFQANMSKETAQSCAQLDIQKLAEPQK